VNIKELPTSGDFTSAHVEKIVDLWIQLQDLQLNEDVEASIS
jgi:hypothetical protein